MILSGTIAVNCLLRNSIRVAGSGFLQSYQMFHQHCRARYLKTKLTDSFAFS